MAKHIKGTLFLDYVRMIKKRKNVDWSKYLTPEDFEIINQMILPSQWYPLESFQRMGVAVFHEIAQGDMETVREWGRRSMDELLKTYKNLGVKGDPHDTLEKFKILRSRFFDFEGLEFVSRTEKSVSIRLDLAFEGVAEEAYAFQMTGSIERLLELSNAKNISRRFVKRAWEGDNETILEFSWE